MYIVHETINSFTLYRILQTIKWSSKIHQYVFSNVDAKLWSQGQLKKWRNGVQKQFFEEIVNKNDMRWLKKAGD